MPIGLAATKPILFDLVERPAATPFDVVGLVEVAEIAAGVVRVLVLVQSAGGVAELARRGTSSPCRS